jgi:hypothetical protein
VQDMESIFGSTLLYLPLNVGHGVHFGHVCHHWDDITVSNHDARIVATVNGD